MAVLFDIGMFSINDTDGSIGVGWKLNFYITGTSTRKNTYPTEADAVALTNANANPVIVPSDGRVPEVWLLEDAEYKGILTDENDVVKETRDPVYSLNTPTVTLIVAMNFLGTPTATQLIGLYTFERAATFPANFSGAYGDVATTNPGSNYAIDVKLNGSSIGTITISSAGAFTFATSGGTTKAVAAGDLLTFVAPGSGTCTDIAATLRATAT